MIQISKWEQLQKPREELAHEAELQFQFAKQVIVVFKHIHLVTTYVERTNVATVPEQPCFGECVECVECCFRPCVECGEYVKLLINFT